MAAAAGAAMTGSLRPPRTLIALAVAGALAATFVPRDARGGGGRIVVPRQATVAAEEIRLGDVAELAGDAAGFADVALGRAPRAGETLRLSGDMILRRLRAAGLDDATTLYTIPPSVRVARAFQEVSEHELREAVRAAVESGLAEGESVEEVGVPAGARIPLGAYAVEVEPAAAAPGPGRARRVEARVVQDGSVVARVAARVTIAASGTVVVARSAIARGAVVGAGDVELEERSLAGLPGSLVRDLDEAVGKEAKVAIAAGRPIAASSLVARNVVRKGDVVRVLVETPGLRLSVAAEALEDAAQGESVRVSNTTSGRELTGRVVGHGLVVVAN
jgi:flagella basal body P-ring formation protein FlgA